MKILPKILQDIETPKNTIFRGHADATWKIISSIGRNYSGDWAKVIKWELEALENFKKRTVPYLKYTPQSDIEWLSLMQHHGCPTRLIDFTTNPLIALFFASDPNVKSDGSFIIAQYKNVIDVNDCNNIFKIDKNSVFHPPHITERIIGQSGCFVLCKTPNKELNANQLKKILIPKGSKTQIRSELRDLDIKASTLFPGIDGICEDLGGTLVDELFFEEFFT
jgi:hypothetical protein